MIWDQVRMLKNSRGSYSSLHKVSSAGATRLLLTIVFILFLAIPRVLYANDFFNIPPQSPPERYGNILINRTSKNHDVQAATFSHWSHRIGYACRVCHTELEFNFQVNTTKITEKANKEGKFCGACHNGKDAFGHTKDNCEKCHNSNIDFGREKFAKLKDLPRSPDGNGVDWVAAFKKGAIKPKMTLAGDYHPVIFERKLVLAPDWNLIPPVTFPHKEHIEVLDCSNCHPDIFNIKKKTTKHFSMERILNSEFCGVCHLRIAFPLTNCHKCHRN